MADRPGRLDDRPGRLDDRLTAKAGRFYLPALDALVRLPLEQSRRDREAGRSVGVFLTGYPGSPLAGLDLALARRAELLAAEGVVHVPGANEELAATALMGTQMLEHHPHERFEGVVGFWYGKGPGADRSGDAFKHGNFAGTSSSGAVVLLSGEDHEAKSSTLPFQEDYAFQAAGIPVLYPGTVQELLSYGLHAVSLSRFSGCWVALKLVSALCDSGETVDLALEPHPVLPRFEVGGRAFEKRTDFSFFPGRNLEIERHLYEERHAAVAEYVRANGLDRLEVGSAGDRLCIVSAGKSFADLRQALASLGLDRELLGRAGIRLVQIGLVYPLDAATVRGLVGGVERVIVVEEKRGFLEYQLRAALLELHRPVEVLGKRDASGRPLFPLHGGMDADGVAERLGPLLVDLVGDSERAAIERRLSELAQAHRREQAPLVVRTPNYCSGCPHSTSTRLAPGQVAWGSPGCHSFASVIEQPERHIEAMTQLGGEGAPWIGLSPFTERRHIVQNVGDGSLFHSSYLNIRFCVAAGVDITFKILFNGFVANTGAQEAVGAKSVVDLARLLALEGVSRVAVVSKTPRAYRRAGFPGAVTLHPASDVERVGAELAALGGVTVLIYDETCANERRRRQKRGLLPPPERFVLINERVCEGCGDCGRRSNCMSLEEVETGLGPKTRVHASSCNQDFSCLAGNCPAFATVRTKKGSGYAPHPASELDDLEVPEPAGKVRPESFYHIVLPGVGGTGVITVNAVLATAFARDGWQLWSYDQTGAAQKWGPVLSSLVLTAESQPFVQRSVGVGQADLYLAFDPVSATAPANLERCDPARTAAVVNTTPFATGEMVRDVRFRPSAEALVAAVARRVDGRRLHPVAARRLAESILGNHQMANVVALGTAYQAGLLPVRAESIEAALRLNGVAVEENRRAFRLGRWWVHDPAAVTAALARRMPPDPFRTEAPGGPGAETGLSRRRRRQGSVLLGRAVSLEGAVKAAVEPRALDLVGYQGGSWAGQYVDFVVEVAGQARRAGLASSEVATAVAISLHKLMSYKDEYEVARLYREPSWNQQLSSTFAAPLSVKVHLYPPVLRRFGLRRKIALGPWFAPFFGLLARMRFLRGTPFDPFGATRHRREERALISWYRQLVSEALEQLSGQAGAKEGCDGPVAQALLLEIARLPEAIRGYDDLKHSRAEAARRRGSELLEELAAAARSPATGWPAADRAQHG